MTAVSPWEEWLMRLCLVLIALLLCAGEAAAQTKSKGIRLWNLTSEAISGFQLSPAGKTDWGANQTLNDKDKEVDHDERLRITGIEPGRYDAKVAYPNGRQCVVRDIEIKADSVFSIADKDLKDCSK
jgi:hypothetical protein